MESTSGSWQASFRVAAGELTDAQLATASWVRVEASRNGVLVASNEAAYAAHKVTLTIPDAGAVNIHLTGYDDAAKSTVMWTGSGTVASGVAAPGKNVVTLTAGPGLASSTNSVTDTAGQSYKVVKIGLQTWMAENFNYKGNGTDTIGHCNNDDPTYCAKYGRLYTWAEVMAIDTAFTGRLWGGSDVRHRGICPKGWHVPSDAEWRTLVSFVESDSRVESNGGGMALQAENGWSDDSSGNSGNGNDLFGFRALPGGFRAPDGFSFAIGYYGYWWSASEPAGISAWSRRMNYANANVDRSEVGKAYGFSLRCTMD